MSYYDKRESKIKASFYFGRVMSEKGVSPESFALKEKPLIISLMITAVAYLTQRFLFGFVDFLNHWYVSSFFNMSHFMLGVFEGLDKIFAIKINIRNWFKPLYQDSGFLGHILGFVARTVRIFLAIIIYIPLFLISVALYIVFISIPILVVYQIFLNYNAGT